LIIVDASAVVAALTREAGAESVRTELVQTEMHAPTLLDYEVAAALRGLTLGGHLSPERALDALGDLDDLPVRRWSVDDALRRRGYALRHAVPAYDAAYVALAEALEAPLVTRDARLACCTGHDAEIWLR
jgi:predicted nucleic acid-binding protein